ncbi:alpha/beta fold hydrolase [Pseudomonas aeruginosa]|nr:alpha/beta fold hydrolase [Pseudomonas aeruginosa]
MTSSATRAASAGCWHASAQRTAGWSTTTGWMPTPASKPLASQVLDGLAEEPDWLIGYSFGGLVGYEMARQLPASRLLMIDSHLPWPALRRMPPSEQYQRWLSAEMREWIALMSELGELREEVLLRNVELFGRWQPAIASPAPAGCAAGTTPAATRPPNAGAT